MFNQLKLTNAGLSILTQITTGEKLEFISIELGSGSFSGDVETLTSLVKVEQSIDITRLQINENDTIIIGGNLLGEDVVEGFFWKEVGIKGKIQGTSNEVLVAYDNAGEEASYIPAGGAVVEQLIDFLIRITNSSATNIVIDDSMMFITKSQYDNDMSEMDALIARKATKTESEQGTNDSKYMTPKGVKDAVNAYSITTPGNYELIVSGSQPQPKAGKTIIWIDTNS